MTAFTLKNGFKVVLIERKDLNSITVNLWVKAGASYERDENRGVAHFLEHALFNGSQKYGEGEIDRIVEELGGELNAATSYDYTYYYVNLPSFAGLRALELLFHLVCRPKITKEAVDKEKPIVLEEIARSLDSPQEVFFQEFYKELYDSAPYRYPILGFPETVASFTRETVEEFYGSLYTPDRMGIVVVGNFKTEEAVREVEELFGSLEGKSSLKEPKFKESETEGKEFEVKHPLAAVPYCVFGWKLPPCGRDDVYYEILSTLLSTGRSSILYRELREKGVVYAAYSNYQNLLISSNFSVVLIGDDVEKGYERARELLKEVLDVKEEEFLFAKRKLYKGELFARESGEAQGDAAGFASVILRDEAYYTHFFSDLERATLEEFKEKVNFLLKEPVVGRLIPQTV
ncbi:M16 family metallopeptidase [Thermovibrio sp.]